MSSLKLFTHPLSQPARAIQLFVRANAIPHEDITVDLAKGEQLTEEYAKVNPLRKIPVINHDGFFLKESVAILRYLSRAFPVPDNWFPSESKAQARVDEYLEWQHLNTRLHGTLFFAEKFLLPLKTGQPVNEKKAATFLKGYKSVLTQIEEIWLKDRPFVGGENVSIADLLACSEIEQTALGGYDVKDHNPKIREYLERVQSTLNPHYDEVYAVLHKIAKKEKLAK